MATALTRYTVQDRPENPALTCMDALALACTSDGVQIISTPNMTFVPEPHLGAEELRIRADGGLGTADCFQWPQMYCKEYEYAVCIPRQESHAWPDPLGWAWYTPTPEDFEESSTTQGRGNLVASRVAGLASLLSMATKRYNKWRSRRGEKKDIAFKWIQDLQHTLDLLFTQPLLLRDIVVLVGQAQRSFLDIYAFLEFVEIVNPLRAYPSVITPPVRMDWMGAFTNESAVCQELFSAGIPVWFVRADHSITPRTTIKTLVRFTFPDSIMRALYSEKGRLVPNAPLLHSGPGGLARHFNSRRQYSPDLTSASPVPPKQVDSQVGKAQTRAQTRKGKTAQTGISRRSGGNPSRNKWESLAIPEMPEPLTVWKTAMERASKQPKPTAMNGVDPGYRVPEPALLVSCQSAERRQILLTNWLSIRQHWLTSLDDNPPVHFPSPQMWRDFLGRTLERKEAKGTVPTRAQKLKKAGLELFGDCHMLILGSEWGPKDHVYWREEEIALASLANPPARLIRAILWEVYEIGFRTELRALDQALVPHLWQNHRALRVEMHAALFPQVSGMLFWNSPVPQQSGATGLTDGVDDGEDFLRRLCVLLSTWPHAPGCLAITQDFTAPERRALVHIQVSEACFFYVDTFYKSFARPPLVPHRFPLDYLS